MVGDYFGMCLGVTRKVIDDHACDPLMILLSPTLEQRAIGRILHQSMLEGVFGIRGYPTPENQLCCDELLQAIQSASAVLLLVADKATKLGSDWEPEFGF